MAYILMDKIHPVPVQNYLLRRDAPLQISNCLSELGVFGAYVRYVITMTFLIFHLHCVMTRWHLKVFVLSGLVHSFQL